MTTATPLRSSREAFARLQLLATELTVFERKIKGPDSPEWDDFWQMAERFEAVENSARRATGWRGCVFGPDANCPKELPITCQACTPPRPTEDPLRVISTRIETDEDGQRREVFELDM